MTVETIEIVEEIEKREPVQLSTAIGTDDEGNTLIVTNVIANDGTMWELTDTSSGWVRLPDLPQDEEHVSEECKYSECYGTCQECPYDNKNDLEFSSSELKEAVKFVNSILAKLH